MAILHTTPATKTQLMILDKTITGKGAGKDKSFGCPVYALLAHTPGGASIAMQYAAPSG